MACDFDLILSRANLQTFSKPIILRLFPFFAVGVGKQLGGSPEYGLHVIETNFQSRKFAGSLVIRLRRVEFGPQQKQRDKKAYCHFIYGKQNSIYSSSNPLTCQNPLTLN